MMKLDDTAQDEAPIGDEALEATDDTSTDADDGDEDDNGDEDESL